MAHTADDKKKLLNRVRRIRGQVESIERAIDEEAECSDVLHNISACRGAMDALMAEVIEGHIRFHVLDAKIKPSAEQTKAADDLMLPRVHRVVWLLKRWLLGTHQGAVSFEHLDYYLDEFTFRFNRRKSGSRGKLFFRLVQQAVAVEPTTYRSIVRTAQAGWS
jgi:DNA-binding FrmR family transcriptional regulator